MIRLATFMERMYDDDFLVLLIMTVISGLGTIIYMIFGGFTESVFLNSMLLWAFLTAAFMFIYSIFVFFFYLFNTNIQVKYVEKNTAVINKRKNTFLTNCTNSAYYYIEGSKEMEFIPLNLCTPDYRFFLNKNQDSLAIFSADILVKDPVLAWNFFDVFGGHEYENWELILLKQITDKISLETEGKDIINDSYEQIVRTAIIQFFPSYFFDVDIKMSFVPC